MSFLYIPNSMLNQTNPSLLDLITQRCSLLRQCSSHHQTNLQVLLNYFDFYNPTSNLTNRSTHLSSNTNEHVLFVTQNERFRPNLEFCSKLHYTMHLNGSRLLLLQSIYYAQPRMYLMQILRLIHLLQEFNWFILMQ